MNELQAGIELALAVLPESSAFLQPGERTFDHPSLRDDGKRVQIIAFGDLHSGTDGTLDRFGKRLTDIAAIGQDTLHPVQICVASIHRLQSALAIGNVRRGHRNGVRQPLRAHRNMPLDPRDLLAGVIAFLSRRVRVLHALRVHDQERRAGVAPLLDTRRTHLIFLMPAPAG